MVLAFIRSPFHASSTPYGFDLDTALAAHANLVSNEAPFIPLSIYNNSNVSMPGAPPITRQATTSEPETERAQVHEDVDGVGGVSTAMDGVEDGTDGMVAPVPGSLINSGYSISNEAADISSSPSTLDQSVTTPTHDEGLSAVSGSSHISTSRSFGPYTFLPASRSFHWERFSGSLTKPMLLCTADFVA
ncbi:hypothetical protein PENSPDRAFT_173491 [Peniophora sp. CONT]|nr:hypothetical protein PENSPDRAFT_173491 [Peniophora sp. CONT]